MNTNTQSQPHAAGEVTDINLRADREFTRYFAYAVVRGRRSIIYTAKTLDCLNRRVVQHTETSPFTSHYAKLRLVRRGWDGWLAILQWDSCNPRARA